MRDVRDCIVCLKLSQIERTKLRMSCTLVDTRYQRYTARGQAFVLTPELSSFRLLIDEPSFLVPWIWVGIHLFFLSLSLPVSISCLVSILSLLHPLPRCGIRSELWHEALGNFVASFSCSTYRSVPHESLMTKAEVKKLRRTVWRCISATFLRNEVTRLCKKSFASANNLFVQ